MSLQLLIICFWTTHDVRHHPHSILRTAEGLAHRSEPGRRLSLAGGHLDRRGRLHPVLVVVRVVTRVDLAGVGEHFDVIAPRSVGLTVVPATLLFRRRVFDTGLHRRHQSNPFPHGPGLGAKCRPAFGAASK